MVCSGRLSVRDTRVDPTTRQPGGTASPTLSASESRVIARTMTSNRRGDKSPIGQSPLTGASVTVTAGTTVRGRRTSPTAWSI